MIAWLLVAALAQAQTPARDARPPAAAGGTAIVRGTVVSADAQPRPLRRVRVTLMSPGVPPGSTAITGDDGTFAFDRQRGGRYALTAFKDGYVMMPSGPGRSAQPSLRIAVADGETQNVTLRLSRGAVITGVVVDVDGQPAQGIAVSALSRRYIGAMGERRFMPSGVTASPSDDRGIYRIYGLPAGEYVIAAQPQARQAGLAGAEVRMLSQGRVSQRPLMLSQVFHPAATDVGRAIRVAVAAGEERSGVDVQLQYVPLASVSGNASAGPGWNPASINMVRTDEVPGFDPPRTARVDGDGRFSFSGIPPGQYRLLARSTAASPVTTSGSPLIAPPGNIQTAWADVIVDGDDVSGVALALQPALTISGRVVFEGGRPVPAPGELRVPVPAALTVANVAYTFPPVEIHGDGTFTIAGVVPGQYRFPAIMQGVRTPIGAWWLKSLVAGGRNLLDGPLDLRQTVSDATVTFADDASGIAGRLTDATGAAVRDAFVVVFSTDRAFWFFNSRRIVGTRATPDGRYSIRNLPPGDYRILATADLEQGEWFDPAVLERLLPSAPAITVTGAEKKTQDIVIRN
jgi:Carboxypeptidase regulatory-like domain